MSDSLQQQRPTGTVDQGSPAGIDCGLCQQHLDAYMAGETPGMLMVAISTHLNECAPCAAVYTAEEEMHTALAALRHASPPAGLQVQLRSAVAAEFAAARHLPWYARGLALWEAVWAPVAMRVAAASMVTVMLIGTVGLLLGAPDSVQANDQPHGALTPPHFLYAVVPPMAVPTGGATPGSIPLLVQADVDSAGRVYDYRIVTGPHDAAVLRAVEANLLNSVFQPATIFGVPARGHVMLTYTGISVKG